MEAIAFFGVLESLPEEARAALTREAVRLGVPVEQVMRAGLLELADSINGPRPGDAQAEEERAA